MRRPLDGHSVSSGPPARHCSARWQSMRVEIPAALRTNSSRSPRPRPRAAARDDGRSEGKDDGDDSSIAIKTLSNPPI